MEHHGPFRGDRAFALAGRLAVATKPAVRDEYARRAARGRFAHNTLVAHARRLGGQAVFAGGGLYVSFAADDFAVASSGARRRTVLARALHPRGHDYPARRS